MLSLLEKYKDRNTEKHNLQVLIDSHKDQQRPKGRVLSCLGTKARREACGNALFRFKNQANGFAVCGDRGGLGMCSMQA